ncbi:hypothetical protein Nmel_018341 [Mimus melanotis]
MLSAASLAGTTTSLTITTGDAGDVKAPGADGHSLRAEDAANGSGGGGSHHGVLWEGAEDGARQGHQHSGRLNDDVGALALPDTALIAAVGQRAGAAGLAARVAGLALLALLRAGHVWSLALQLAQRAGRKQSTRTRETQPARHPKQDKALLPAELQPVQAPAGHPLPQPSTVLQSSARSSRAPAGAACNSAPQPRLSLWSERMLCPLPTPPPLQNIARRTRSRKEGWKAQCCPREGRGERGLQLTWFPRRRR